MNQTTLTNIDIPFWRLSGIILKFMLASIPAILLLYLVVGFISVAAMALFGGLIAGSGLIDGLNSSPELKEVIESAKGGQ